MTNPEGLPHQLLFLTLSANERPLDTVEAETGNAGIKPSQSV